MGDPVCILSLIFRFYLTKMKYLNIHYSILNQKNGDKTEYTLYYYLTKTEYLNFHFLMINQKNGVHTLLSFDKNGVPQLSLFNVKSENGVQNGVQPLYCTLNPIFKWIRKQRRGEWAWKRQENVFFVCNFGLFGFAVFLLVFCICYPFLFFCCIYYVFCRVFFVVVCLFVVFLIVLCIFYVFCYLLCCL